MARLRNKHCSRLHALLLELEVGGIGSPISVNKANRLLEGVVLADEVARHWVICSNAGFVRPDIEGTKPTVPARLCYDDP